MDRTVARITKNKELVLAGEIVEGAEGVSFSAEGDLMVDEIVERVDYALEFDDTGYLDISPAAFSLDPDNFTMQVNERVVSFRGDETATIEDGKVVVGGRNLVRNGDFRQGRVPWIPSRDNILSLDNVNKVIGFQSAKVTVSNAIAHICYHFNDYEQSNKYYITLYIKTDISAGYCWFFTSMGGVLVANRVTVFNVSSNYTEWKRLSFIEDEEFDRLVLGNSSVFTGMAWIDGVAMINLTAMFGPGNEPSKEECDILFANWIPAPEDITSLTQIDRTLPYFPGDGTLKTLRFYDRGLSDAEMMQNWNAGHGEDYVKDGLVFDGDFVGEGDVLPDISGEGNDAGIEDVDWVEGPPRFEFRDGVLYVPELLEVL